MELWGKGLKEADVAVSIYDTLIPSTTDAGYMLRYGCGDIPHGHLNAETVAGLVRRPFFLPMGTRLINKGLHLAGKGAQSGEYLRQLAESALHFSGRNFINDAAAINDAFAAEIPASVAIPSGKIFQFIRSSGALNTSFSGIAEKLAATNNAPVMIGNGSLIGFYPLAVSAYETGLPMVFLFDGDASLPTDEKSFNGDGVGLLPNNFGFTPVGIEDALQYMRDRNLSAGLVDDTIRTGGTMRKITACMEKLNVYVASQHAAITVPPDALV